MAKQVFEIDGTAFKTLEEFYEEVGHKIIPNADWGHNLDAFNDILRGGFGTPEGGFIIRWRNSALSRERLGNSETVRQLQLKLRKCHPTNRPSVSLDLEAAKNGTFPTAFEWLVEIINCHCKGGAEAEDGIELELV